MIRTGARRCQDACVPDPHPDAPAIERSRPWLQHYDDDVPAEVEVEDRPFAELLDRGVSDEDAAKIVGGNSKLAPHCPPPFLYTYI